jgi:hypothetical protein
LDFASKTNEIAHMCIKKDKIKNVTY